MTAQYSDEQIEEYEANRLKWLQRAHDLPTTFVTFHFGVEQAGEFARAGFSRRLGSLEHAVERIDDVYPPNLANAPTRKIRDVELIVQSFTMNIFGAIDNLAWIWALERYVKRSDGKPLAPTEMVFHGHRSKHLIASLTPPLIALIQRSRTWFEAISIYRHGIAHQIPIYIPRLCSPADREEARQLNLAIAEAMNAGQTNQVRSLLHQKNTLGAYGAMMAMNGEQRPLLLHPQMICDLATVVELGETIIAEIARPIVGSTGAQ